MKREYVRVIGLSVALVGPACNEPCDHSGQRAMDKVQPDDGQRTRLAGYVAAIGDVRREDGCFATSLSYTELWVYQPQSGVRDMQLDALFRAEPLLKHRANKRYELDLPAGDYYVCMWNMCSAVTLFEGRTTTLNVAIHANAGFWLARPDELSTTQVENTIPFPGFIPSALGDGT